jgi:AMMECR1 domain-containing protein
VVLSVGSRRATFLPQVWEKLPEKAVFLQHLSNKAGLGPTGWTNPEAQVSIYRVRAFKETDHPQPKSSPSQAPPTREH